MSVRLLRMKMTNECGRICAVTAKKNQNCRICQLYQFKLLSLVKGQWTYSNTRNWHIVFHRKKKYNDSTVYNSKHQHVLQSGHVNREHLTFFVHFFSDYSMRVLHTNKIIQCFYTVKMQILYICKKSLRSFISEKSAKKWQVFMAQGSLL